MDTFTIGQLAKAGGVPTSTVRYYERVGLLRPDARTQSSYRLYGLETLERLRFIRSAQAIGFNLEAVRELLRLMSVSTASCREVQVLIERRLSALSRQIEDLKTMELSLRAALKQCRKSKPKGECPVLANRKRRRRF